MPNLQALAAVPSFGSQLGQALGGGISQGISSNLNEMLQQREQKSSGSALAQYLGKPEMSGILSSLPREFQLEIAKSHLKNQQNKQLEKQASLGLGLETIEKMRTLIPSAGPSNYIQSFFGGDTTRNRAELEALGRSLIPLVAAGVPVRNQREFDEYRKIITNPNALQSELEGALNGLQDIFTRSLEGQEPSNQTTKERASKETFNPENPKHKERAIKLHKALKNKGKVREQLAKEFTFDVD